MMRYDLVELFTVHVQRIMRAALRDKLDNTAAIAARIVAMHYLKEMQR